MIGAHRLAKTAVVVVCVLMAQARAPLFASEAATTAPTSVSPRAQITLPSSWLAIAPAEPGAAARHDFRFPPAEFNATGQVYRGAPYPYPHRHDAALTAIAIGAAAAITGTAVLVYANRPECSFDPYAGGCGYGFKVVGTSVLAGGLVGLFVGALTW